MSHPSLPKEVRDYLIRTKSTNMHVVLLSPSKAEGVAIFDPADAAGTVRGDFFPTTQIEISAAVSGQFLLSKSGVVLNVILTPGRADLNEIDHCRFEIEAWKPLIETHQR